MKVFINHQLPFLLAHGGLQTQMERTKTALKGVGFKMDNLRDSNPLVKQIRRIPRCPLPPGDRHNLY